MIQVGSKVNIANNCGVKMAKVIKVYNSKKSRIGECGDIVKVSVQTLTKNSPVKKGKLFKALVVTTKSQIYRKSLDIFIWFGENRVVLLNTEGKDCLGTKIVGKIPKECLSKVNTKDFTNVKSFGDFI